MAEPIKLDRSSILSAPDLPTIPLEIPEWGGTVVLKALTGEQRDRFEVFVAGNNRANIRARLAALSLVDESGKPLFSEADIVALGQKNAKALDRIWDAASSLNKLTENDIEGLEKN